MMTRLVNVKVWAAAIVLLAMSSSLGAQQQAGAGQDPPQTVTPSGLQLQTIEKYVVGKAKPPEVPGTKVVDLTLEQCYQIALDKNLDLQSAKLNPIVQDYNLRSLRAQFLPSFSGSYSYNNNSQVSENTLDGVARTVSQSNSLSSSMSLRLPFHGSSLNGNFGGGRSTSNLLTARINPNLNASVGATFTMPILQGFLIDSTRNSLRTAPIQRQVADITLQQTIESTKTQIRTAYWNLRQSIEQIEISKMALDMARRQLADNKARVEIGTMAPIETAQPEATVASSEQGLLNAEISWRNSELAMKALLVAGVEDDLYGSTLNPTDLPTAAAPPTVDIKAAIVTALAQRSDVQITRKNVEIAELGMEVTKNALMPSLSLSSNFSAAGSGGNLFSQGVLTKPGGIGDALGAIAHLDTPRWGFGFNFSYPLGMASAKANYATQVISLQQRKLTAKRQELTVSTDVTQRGLNVENTYKQLLAAQKNRDVSEKNLEAELTRFDVGLSNNFTVSQIQQQVTNARLSELTRLIAYINALAEYERAQKFPG